MRQKNIMKQNKNKGKQLRKPVSTNFSPKRLAINFDPPMIIIQYLVIDTGKLYHHKMRLDSILRKTKATREDVLNYIKTKHHLYFVNGKVKDAQLYKFIDKILSRKGISAKMEKNSLHSEASDTPNRQNDEKKIQNNDDFDYLNDQQEQEEYYDEDYEDYEDASNYVNDKINNQKQVHSKVKQKNAFMAYKQQDEEEEEHANWDLDLDENDDFV